MRHDRSGDSTITALCVSFAIIFVAVLIYCVFIMLNTTHTVRAVLERAVNTSVTDAETDEYIRNINYNIDQYNVSDDVSNAFIGNLVAGGMHLQDGYWQNDSGAFKYKLNDLTIENDGKVLAAEGELLIRWPLRLDGLGDGLKVDLKTTSRIHNYSDQAELDSVETTVSPMQATPTPTQIPEFLKPTTPPTPSPTPEASFGISIKLTPSGPYLLGDEATVVITVTCESMPTAKDIEIVLRLPSFVYVNEGEITWDGDECICEETDNGYTFLFEEIVNGEYELSVPIYFSYTEPGKGSIYATLLTDDETVGSASAKVESAAATPDPEVTPTVPASTPTPTPVPTPTPTPIPEEALFEMATAISDGAEYAICTYNALAGVALCASDDSWGAVSLPELNSSVTSFVYTNPGIFVWKAIESEDGYCFYNEKFGKYLAIEGINDEPYIALSDEPFAFDVSLSNYNSFYFPYVYSDTSTFYLVGSSSSFTLRSLKPSNPRIYLFEKQP